MWPFHNVMYFGCWFDIVIFSKTKIVFLTTMSIWACHSGCQSEKNKSSSCFVPKTKTEFVFEICMLSYGYVRAISELTARKGMLNAKYI